MILLITSPRDPGSQALIREIADQGSQAVVFNYADLTDGASVTLQLGMARGDPAGLHRLRFADGSVVTTDAVRAVWFGRPEGIEPIEGGALERRFVLQETTEALGGLWQILGVPWINHPVYDDIASRKPYQLAMARGFGMRIPATTITNDPDIAREFIEELGVGRVVHKTFVATEEFWRETRVVRENEFSLLEAVRHAPVIFQELIEAEADIRVIVIGEHIFAVAITRADAGHRIDYRVDLGSCTFEAIELPASVAAQLVSLVRSMNLVYGAIDLLRSRSGEYVFLEINPCGQWLFVEERTGLPITRCLAEALVRVSA